MNDLLTIRNLSKKFGRKIALNQVSFSIQPSRIVGLMGPNGAGKTTLLKTIAGIYQPDSGSVEICQEPGSHKTKRNIAFVPDTNPLPDWMKVKDAIHYSEDMFADFDSSKAADLCALLGLDSRDKISTLSNGMRQRVLVMLAFARRARLYLLDEPISGIDPLDRDKLIKTILAGLNEDSSILISTHLVKDIETSVDEVIFLHQGRLVFNETAENIRSQRNQSVEQCYMEVLSDAQAH